MSLRNLRQTATAGKYTDVTQRKSPFSKRQSPLNTSTQYANPVFHLPFPPVIPQRRDGQDTPLRDKATPAWGQTQPYIATVTITNLVVSVENLLFADSAICREPTHTYTATHEVVSATLTGSPPRDTLVRPYLHSLLVHRALHLQLHRRERGGAMDNGLLLLRRQLTAARLQLGAMSLQSNALLALLVRPLYTTSNERSSTHGKQSHARYQCHGSPPPTKMRPVGCKC